jgi:endonuclease/exonuclease/phosphatase family metal-dependent hydrolase
MKRTLLIIGLLFSTLSLFAGQYTIGTWNMKWLGGSEGKLDDTENINRYVSGILDSKATLFAIQEITPSMSEKGVVKCQYLDLIVAELNKTQKDWTYYIDTKNKSQRLGFLYDSTKWKLVQAKCIPPGKAFRGNLRKPLLGTFQPLYNPSFTLDVMNIHLKAFPDGKEMRIAQFEQIADWLKTNSHAENMVICGDTNIYKGEDPTAPLKAIDFIEAKCDEDTAIHEDALNQKFDRFFLSKALFEKNKEVIADSKQETAKGNFKDFEENVSDHFPVTIVVAN